MGMNGETWNDLDIWCRCREPPRVDGITYAWRSFQGVLVKESDLENTMYKFELEDGSFIEVKGNEEIEYDGETHSAANLFDALKEGYYGKF